MKKHYFLLSLLLSAAAAISCSSEADELAQSENPANGIQTSQIRTVSFPQDDGAVQLDGTGSEMLLALLKQTDLDNALTIGETNIADEEYQEIKIFTDDLVKSCTSDQEKYQAIYKWVTTNVSYANADNDPYPVFVNRKGVCQGYSNLMKVMLLTQGIPVLIANGYAYGMGHAWNYVCYNGKWRVCDATNKGNFDAESLSTYAHLSPMRADIILFEDDNFAYDYSAYCLNVAKVKKGEEQTAIPFSVNGFRVTSLNPQAPLPDNIRELYVGKNIETLGTDLIGLKEFGTQLEAVHVDEANQRLRSYKGAVYQKNGTDNYLYYVPGQLDFLKLLPMEKVEKNVVYGQTNLRTIEFAEGTTYIEAYAVENCPNLEKAYVPKEATIEENAFYGVAPNFEVIRGNSTGIAKITF